MNGILLIDKPKEYTSHDIVAIVKKITGEKVGHTGTLDPNATGVLPLLVGKATLISKYLINHNKTYIATLKLGIKTDTADGEGNVVEQQDISKLLIKKEEIEKVLKKITGKQEQVPPMYSAIKVKGKKLYEYARKGQDVKIEPRKIEIYDTNLLEYKPKEAEIVFEITCSKGTYIRTVCENIAERLNTVGYMKELKRIKVGDFAIENAIQIDVFKNYPEKLEEALIPIERFFSEKEIIELSNKELQLFLNGVKLTKNNKDELYRIYNNNQFIGLGIVENNRLKREIIV